MLKKIIAFSVQNKLIIGLFIIGLVGYGAYQVTRLPIDAVPDITDNQVQVITVTPALGAPDVERLITFPIEQVNNNIPGLKNIRSFSRFGLSVVTIVFDDKTDVYWARQQVNERLQQVQIPEGLGAPELAPVTTGLGEVYQYTIRPKKGYEQKYNAMDMRTIQDWIVRRQLLGVKGVADVSSFGGYLKQYEIAAVPAKLQANNITINDIFTALRNNNQNTGGAYIEKGPTVLFIRSEGLIGTIEDIQNIVIKNLENGTPLLIRDVAEVGFGSATRYGAMTFNGEEEVAGAVVMMLKGANSNEVIRNIKERIGHIQKILPEGIMIDPFLDRTKMVNNSIRTVATNLIEGALIVVFILVLFLGNLRAGLLVASVIPISMLFAIIMMNIFGVSGNLMSLGALDFGLIVDGAVIIVEAVMHRLTHSKHFDRINRLSKGQMDGEVKQSASRMMNSAVFGQVIILVVYFPIFALEGIEGKMFRPMAQTVAFALLGAFILSLTYIPMMSTLVLSKKISHKRNFSDRMMGALERIYQRVLTRVLNFPKLVLAGTLLLFALAIFILTRLGGEFIPSLPEGDFAVETRVLPGSNLNTSTAAVSSGARILLQKFPEVMEVVGKTGSSEIPTDPMPIDASDMMVILKDKKDWTSASTYPELEAKMSKELEAIPGVSFGFQYPVQMRFNELISGARQDVVCKIFGEDLDTLASYAVQIGNIVNSVPGSSGLYVESVTGIPQIVIQYNRAAIAQYGLNISDINRVVNTAFAGQSSGTVYEGEKRFDLVVRLSGEERKNLQDVQNLLIPAANGIQIPLNNVAKVEMKDGPNQIQRENAQRRILVGFNVRGRDVQSMVKELQEKIDARVKMLPGYYITYGGAFQNLKDATNRLAIAVPVSLLLIFLILYFAFNSVRQGLLIYSAIPLSAIGGILALAIRGMPFSISAGVGFIALFGVAVLNGIVLVAEFNRLKKEGMEDLKRIVTQGTKIRLRPVLMTASVASLGFLPMALSTGEGAEVQRPLATVVIGGLLIATFLTLFVLPILYMIFEKGGWISRKKATISGTAVLAFLFFCYPGLNAQAPINLRSAIDTALKNNLMVKNEQLRAEYHRMLIKSAGTVPLTALTGEVGQLNSSYTDVGIGISQTFHFPKVYTRQNQLLTEEWKSASLNVNIKEAELKKQVSTVYYQLLYLQEKKKLLIRADSIFSDFQRLTRLRFEKGESNSMEKLTAETQRDQVGLQLTQINQDLELLQLQFQLLLNTETAFLPIEQKIKLDIVSDTGISSRMLHPALQYWKQQELVAGARTAVERSKLSPDLTLGYSLRGIRGVGADDKVYDATPRFHSAQIGLGIPIFTAGQKARIRAAKAYETIAAREYEANLKYIEYSFQSALRQYRKHAVAINYFETTSLNNAENITRTATLQFTNGEINYLEWVMLINQAISIQGNYIETLKDLNATAVEINSFTTK